MLNKRPSGNSTSEIDYIFANMFIGDNASLKEKENNSDKHQRSGTIQPTGNDIPWNLATTQQNIGIWSVSGLKTHTIDRPFEILQESELKSRHRLIEDVKRLQLPYTERLYKRICLLNEATEDEYPEQELISIKSFEGFLNFMKSNIRFKYPDITITYDGNVRIQWQQDKNHHLAIEFISDAEAKYIVFSPDPVHPVKTARTTGTVSIDGILIAIEPFKVLDWSIE